MTCQAGVWIDHSQAILVLLRDGELTTRRIASDVEKEVRGTGGRKTATPYGPQDAAPEGRRERRRERHLREFYDEVAAALAGVETVWLLGPGGAKGEFRKRFEETAGTARTVQAARVDGPESVGKLTDAKLVALVREHFEQPARRQVPVA